MNSTIANGYIMIQNSGNSLANNTYFSYNLDG